MNHIVCTAILLLSAVRMGTNAQNDTASTTPPTVESTINTTNTSNTTNNTATPTVNACDTIEAGDVYFTYVQANVPNEVVLFTFEDIPGEIKLYLTDNAWTGTSFQVDEGTLELTVPTEGIAQGTNFGYGPNVNLGQDWVPAEGAFALEPTGEQIFLYCIGATGVVPLAAISYNGPFGEEGLATYGLQESAIPTRLATNGTIVLKPCSEWAYAGPRSGQSNLLKESMMNTDKWKCKKGIGSAAWHRNTLSLTFASLLVGLSTWMLR